MIDVQIVKQGIQVRMAQKLSDLPVRSNPSRFTFRMGQLECELTISFLSAFWSG